jgi:DNA-binding XRE family transcriptional regulator
MTATKIVLNHRSFVLVPESDWLKIASKKSPPAGLKIERTNGGHDYLPPLPAADSKGNRPALAFADAAIARTIGRRRKRLGLSQAGLAKLAGIRAEVLNRAERAKTVPSVRTLTKIENVLQRLERRAKPKRGLKTE